jgi:hypothetical protein
MTSLILVIAVTAFLAGAATAAFLMIVIGIRKADHPRRAPSPQDNPLDAATRTVLGARNWPDGPALGDHHAN